MKRSSLVAIAIACAFAATLRAQENAARPPRLNIVCIVTDDQSRWSVGAYGNKESMTENMDRLAREGAMFTNAFVQTPVCSPSRACFFTSRMGTQVGITDWINAKEGQAGVGIPDAITWPAVLKQNGYATALVGKWHLGDRPQFHPTKHGFDHFTGFLGGGQFPIDPELEVNGQLMKLKGACADLVTDDAIGFITENREKPFAVCITFREPHQPYGPVLPVDSEPFKDLDPTIPKVPDPDVAKFKEWTREYYASIHSVDRNLGKLLAKLDELKLSDHTLVLFTSDHGYMIGQHRLHTKGNAAWVGSATEGPKRPNMFEYSIRVPLIVRWPGVVKPGTTIEQTVTNADTFPTMLAVALPGWTTYPPVQGISFAPLLRGEEMKARDILFGQYDLHNGGLDFMRMARTDKWKLVRHYYSNGLDELYNLEADPEEMKNLYNDESARSMRDELQTKLTQWMKSIDDPILHGLPPVKISWRDIWDDDRAALDD